MDVRNPTNLRIEPVVGALRVVGGARLDAAPCAVVLTPPPLAPHNREDEQVLALLDMTSAATSHLHRELREVISRTYWSVAGSVTAALRQTVSAVNRYLFAFNLHAAPARRCYAGFACVVLRAEDIYIVQAGPMRTCLFHDDHLEYLYREGDLPHLGMAAVADVRLYHAFVDLGSTLLLASSALVRAAGDSGLIRVLSRTDVQEVVAGLEQVGAGANFAALVARLNWPVAMPRPAVREAAEPWAGMSTVSAAPSTIPAFLERLRRRVAPRSAGEPPGRAEAPPTLAQPRPQRRPEPSPPVTPQPSMPEPARWIDGAAEPPVREPPATLPAVPRPSAPEPARPSAQTYEPPVREMPARETPAREPPVLPRAAAARPPRATPPPPVRREGPGLGERVRTVASAIGRGLLAAATWLGAAVAWLASGTVALFRRMLPGREREARRRARPARPVPPENPTLMMSIAVGVLVVVLIIVVVAYNTFGQDERFNSRIRQIEREIVDAQTEGLSEGARPHWETALRLADEAVGERPEDAKAIALREQAQAALDRLDGVIRLALVQLVQLDTSSSPRLTNLRQLVVHGQSIFVLDPEAEWVVELTLNQTNDGVIEGERHPFVRKGQQISEGVVGGLVDLAWVGSGGDRMTSGLVILEEDGVLVSYDPAWGGVEGERQLLRAFLGTPPVGIPRAVGSFDGRFYILDTVENQIWRYEPRGDVYPDRPDRYFVTPPARSLQDAVDMAIDGNVYVLHADGTIIKYLRGEPQSFEVRGVPDGLVQPVALAVDADGSSERLYVADRGNGETGGRVVVLNSDGAFYAQFCAGQAFDALEALAVNETIGRLFAFGGGRLYLALLP